MGAIKDFFTGYWHFADWYLIGIVVVYLVALLILRRPGKAFTVLLTGLYVTMTAYFLSVRERLSFSQETALGMVVVLGLALAAVVYYFMFIRTD
ncbi:MAG TPA: hypothetical protein VMZ92_07780 [Planctomycetota bacterium]|nr:hypothetical protein [Planctomycetota bacterium]